MEERKLEVIPVAIRLFSEKGYNSTSVEEIAKESGMAKGSFYKHFNSKEDLLLEIFTLLPKQMKTGLTKIYSQKYDSRHEKLIDFISMSLENILSNHVHLLMNIIAEQPFFKNKEIVEKAQQTEMELNTWIKEFLVDLYGDKVERYIWDLISLLKGLIFQYIHLFRCQKSEMNSENLSVFMATVFDIIVEGLLKRKPEPILDMDLEILGMFADNNSPRLKGQKIQLLLKRMTHTVKGFKHSEAQEEYLKTVALLEEEYVKEKPKSFLLKALISYLQSVPDLQEDCADLKALLDIE